jgi:hypothetical protein
MRRRHKYADGGKVVKDHGEEKKPKQPQPPDPGALGSGGAAKAGAALKDRRKQQMEELGLRDGGKVKRK